MQFALTPITFTHNEELKELSLKRIMADPMEVIDNWVDTIIFTSIRRFKADEEFGFSFWDNEFIALNFNDFNNGVDFTTVEGRNNRIERIQMSAAGVKLCEQSIKNSLKFYLPYLKDIFVNVSLSFERDKTVTSKRGDNSKYMVKVEVTGHTVFDEYSNTREGDYHRKVTFLMDPFMNNSK